MKDKSTEQESTMDDEYGDGSEHDVCDDCGFCIVCGDCDKYGCGTDCE